MISRKLNCRVGIGMSAWVSEKRYGVTQGEVHELRAL